MVHPGAIYLHNGQTYQVVNLDLNNSLAELREIHSDFYTEPVSKTSIEKCEELLGCSISGGKKYFGEIQVTTQVTAYRKVSWYSHEYLGGGELILPPSELRTTACWFVIHENTISFLRDQGKWSNDPNDYGANWQTQRRLAMLRDQFLCQVCGTPERGRRTMFITKKPLEPLIPIRRPINLIT
jgi:DEAD/DEAH box helicase domain-containing protein